MNKPIVAIVGRPNVGKSTFFNNIIGKRISITEDRPGITRDRIYAEGEWNGIRFDLVDTGGIDPGNQDGILSQMKAQAELAIETASVILFMVDGREGLTAADHEIASILRKTGKKVLLIVNKIDDPLNKPDHYYDFYSLALGEPLPVSSSNKLNFGDVLDEIVASFSESDYEEEDDVTKVAVIGKPNVGKSSLVNAILNENRVIVSSIPGTTRDAIDTPYTWNGERYILIDTAGIRRKTKIRENIEHYSVIRTLSAIERSDVCLVMVDASEGLTEQDKRIAGMAHEAGKGIVIVVNKWDLVAKETNTMRNFTAGLMEGMKFISYAPTIYTSALTGLRVKTLMPYVKAVAENRSMRVATGRLNSVISDAVMMKEPPADKGRRLKIYYVSQIGIKPPLFSFKVNDRELMHFSYARYLENRMRETFGFQGTSIKFVFRGKDKS